MREKRSTTRRSTCALANPAAPMMANVTGASGDALIASILRFISCSRSSGDARFERERREDEAEVIAEAGILGGAAEQHRHDGVDFEHPFVERGRAGAGSPGPPRSPTPSARRSSWPPAARAILLHALERNGARPRRAPAARLAARERRGVVEREGDELAQRDDVLHRVRPRSSLSRSRGGAGGGARRRPGCRRPRRARGASARARDRPRGSDARAPRAPCRARRGLHAVEDVKLPERAGAGRGELMISLTRSASAASFCAARATRCMWRAGSNEGSSSQCGGPRPSVGGAMRWRKRGNATTRATTCASAAGGSGPPRPIIAVMTIGLVSVSIRSQAVSTGETGCRELTVEDLATARPGRTLWTRRPRAMRLTWRKECAGGRVVRLYCAVNTKAWLNRASSANVNAGMPQPKPSPIPAVTGDDELQLASGVMEVARAIEPPDEPRAPASSPHRRAALVRLVLRRVPVAPRKPGA